MPRAPRTLLSTLFEAAIAAADPTRIIPNWLPERPAGRTVVIGAGKASAAMARAFEHAWPHPLEGVVVTPYGHAAPCQRIRVVEAGHPVPDEAGLRATALLFGAVSNLTSDDLVVALMSGGGSALLPAPPIGLSLADEQALTRLLLTSGLPVSDMNLLRKHVSMVKGGRLARAVAPARLVTLVLSDVPGDNPADVSSGPTVPGGGTRQDALALAERLRLNLPPAVFDHLRSTREDAPSRLDRVFQDQEVHVIGSAGLSLAAAAETCRNRFGVPVAILSDAIEGEARDIGTMHAAIAREIALRGHPFTPPVVLLSGGETTVTLAGEFGVGGRNTELALALAIGLRGTASVHALVADTDGIDGRSDVAGAFADGSTVQRLWDAGVDPKSALDNHDSAAAFAAIGDLFVTGPTRTNVNDFRAILIT